MKTPPLRARSLAITRQQHQHSLSLAGLALALTLVAVFYSQHANAGKDRIYRWVDENGITHYGEQPPKKDKIQVDEMKTRKDYSSDAQAAREALKEKREAREEAATKTALPTQEDAERMIAERKKKLEEGCKTAKSNLEVLATHGRVKETGEDGNQRYLSEEEHEERIRKTTQYLKDNCGSSQ